MDDVDEQRVQGLSSEEATASHSQLDLQVGRGRGDPRKNAAGKIGVTQQDEERRRWEDKRER